jgi:hypothetical protein
MSGHEKTGPMDGPVLVSFAKMGLIGYFLPTTSPPSSPTETRIV